MMPAVLGGPIKNRPDGRCRLADGGIQKPEARSQNSDSLL